MPRAVNITQRTLRAARKAERDVAGRFTRHRPAADAYNNWAINIGVGTNNALSGSTYGFNPITRVRTLLEFMYRGSWLARVAIDQVAKDMTRGGVKLKTDAEEEDISILENRMARLRVWPSLCNAIKWARLYGGALAYLQLEGADPETPLRPEAVGPEQFKGVLVLDRWMLEPMLNRLVQEDGPDQGMPEFYRVTTDAPGLRGRIVHHSRCIRLVGIELPYWQRIMENYWGLSVFEPLYDRMVAFDSATMGAAQLAYKAHLRTMKIKNYRQILAAGGQLATGLAMQMEMVRKLQSIEGLTVIDGDDEVEVQTASFSGLSDVILQIGQQISGGLQIPLTKLFGQSPAGLNSTGEADTRNYYDGIKQEQDHTLKDGVHRLYRVASVSEGIDLGEDFDLDFNPLWQLTEDEMSTIEERGSRSVLAVEEAGLISQRTALTELKTRGAQTNTWQSITAEDIDAADDALPEIAKPGELGPDGEPLIKPEPGEPGGKPGEPGGKPGGELKKELGSKDAAPAQFSRRFQGLPVTVEASKGSRRWPGGPVMPAHYGFIRGVGSAEGEDEWMDCMVGDADDAPYAYVLDHYDRHGQFEEHKVMLGFPGLLEARRAHHQAYAGTGATAQGGAQMTTDQLREWMARDKNQRRPVMLADRRKVA